MDYKERNKFFTENYRLFTKISYDSAKSVNDRFPNVLLADLVAYAYEGVIVGLDKVDLTNERWIKFIHKHALGHALSGAFLMSGVQRHRIKGVNGYISNIVVPQSDKLKEIAESEQIRTGKVTDVFFERLETLDERRWFLEEIDGYIEQAVLLRLLLGESVAVISKSCGISDKTIRRISEQLAIIFKHASENKSFDHLTITKKDSKKYQLLTVTNEDKQKYADLVRLLLSYETDDTTKKVTNAVFINDPQVEEKTEKESTRETKSAIPELAKPEVTVKPSLPANSWKSTKKSKSTKKRRFDDEYEIDDEDELNDEYDVVDEYDIDDADDIEDEDDVDDVDDAFDLDDDYDVDDEDDDY